MPGPTDGRGPSRQSRPKAGRPRIEKFAPVLAPADKRWRQRSRGEASCDILLPIAAARNQPEEYRAITIDDHSKREWIFELTGTGVRLSLDATLQLTAVRTAAVHTTSVISA